MDKNAIKKYAVWARRELIARVSQKALQYGITEDNIVDASADSINGIVLTSDEKKQRKALITQIADKGYQEVMEEVAYTWFNRFAALRFMEVNSYLPSHVRVFTDDENGFKPQIIAEAIHLDLDGLDMDKVYELKNANETEELYKYLLITQCNTLNKVLPGMFQKIADYTELLLPDNLLREGSVIEQMIVLISEDDWKDAVQIIGWLYQYYNAEKKDDVFAALKKNVKITKENIPAATQLFTPDWIVRYMIENSLGRLWVEGHPNDELKSGWKYYLDEAEQEPDVQEKLAEIRKEYAALTPEQIKVIDPCCGSGHILAYMFDVLVQIYEAYGYTTREAVSSIVENNIYGLDIDDRAAQLASFAVMMKARQYDRRFFSRGIQPHVYAIVESNHISPYTVDYFAGDDAKLKKAMRTIMDELHDAKEYGSILTVTPQDWSALFARFDAIKNDISMYRNAALEELLPLVQVAQAMAQKYDVVATNPPYLGVSTAKERLYNYVKENYYDAKEDLYLVFIEKCNAFCKHNRFQAMITQHSWMFLSRSEKLRLKVQNNLITSMAHLGARAFEEIGGEVVQTTSFILQKCRIENYVGRYKRLVDPTTQDGKEQLFLSHNSYDFKQDNCKKIPGEPVVYWISNNFINNFSEKAFSDIADCRVGLDTGNNDKFLRLWFEPDYQRVEFVATSSKQLHDISGKKYVPHTKGGEYRKWYGNFEYVIAFDPLNYNLLMESGNHLPSRQFYFLDGLNWTRVSSKFAVRYTPAGMVFNSACPTVFVKIELEKYTLALLNTCVTKFYLDLLSPTINFQAGDVGKVPYLYQQDFHEHVDEITEETVEISKRDWDSFETSWDFAIHPLVRWSKALWDATAIGATMQHFYGGHPEVSCPLELCFMLWQGECEERFNQLKANEEELNRIFIDIYGLQDELTPEVEDKDVTVRKADLTRDIKSFISYAVGCMFGRYSLNVDGLAFAGGEWNPEKYGRFPADADNIIPICDDEYFADDIVGRFVEFVRVVFGEDSLNDNLKYIADALGGKGQPKDVIRKYFLNDFYADHCKMYQKRPIYWLFDSGKKNGFKALIYMHRYQPDTIARIRTDYVHEQQSRYRTAIADLEQRISVASTSERVKLNKQLASLQDQSNELHGYEEKIHHLADQYISIDLDDGVKKNYEIFKDVLAKIK